MEHFKRLTETVSDKRKKYFVELGKLVSDLQSTSFYGIIRTERKPWTPNRPKSFKTFLQRLDGMLETGRDNDDVETKTDCLLDLGKLHSISKRVRNTGATHYKEDSDDEPVEYLEDIAGTCASYFVSFGVQVCIFVLFITKEPK